MQLHNWKSYLKDQLVCIWSMKIAKTAVSLFASSGIGDIALMRCGFSVLVANELLPDRCSLFKKNFPETKMVEGSIWQKKDEIISTTKLLLKGEKLDFVLVTPPCQGMSKNGRGKLLSEINAGRRPKFDPRNLLIIPALEVINALKPETIVFENVSEMVNTCIPFENEILPILTIIDRKLGEYEIDSKVLEFADYGLPQRRQRLITVASKNQNHKIFFRNFNTLLPSPTHSKKPSNSQKPWVTVRDVISNLEPLDGKSKCQSDVDPWHRVSELDDRKYWWIFHTQPGASAFHNQCVECGFDKNPTHRSGKNSEGINRASVQTPIYCESCGALLPRPTVKKDGEVKLMKGFTSAYKRMDWDLPASAITRNFSYVCSDNKIHPEQHRTLSIREACLLHTISDADYVFEYHDGEKAKLTAVRDTLGESIPPTMLSIIFKFLQEISKAEFDRIRN